ncbi:MAG: hypothetical protein LQ341_003754 [Variospora aurantia]|nr:MAG: hypothetical protein LQ341_003754 [Variospora aurantia]
MDDSESLPLTSENLRNLVDSSPRRMRARSITSSDTAWSQSSKIQELFEKNYLCDRPTSSDAPPTRDPAIVEAVQRILNRGSFRPMDSEEAERVVVRLSRAASWRPNKATAFFLFAKEMFPESYQIADGSRPGGWISKQWRDEGLGFTFDEPFDQSAVSFLNPWNESDKQAIDLFPRIRRPQPNITFGLNHDDDENWIQELHWLRRHGYGVSVLRHICHPFLSVHFSKSAFQAQFEAQRACAVLIEANRELQACAGMADLDESEIDIFNMVFSFAIDSAYAVLHVHWARFRNSLRKAQSSMRRIKGFEHHRADGIEYISFRVAAYLLGRKEDVINCRHDLECILSWGTTARMDGPNGMKALMAIVTDMMRAEVAGGPEHKREASMGSACNRSDSKRKCPAEAEGTKKGGPLDGA